MKLADDKQPETPVEADRTRGGEAAASGARFRSVRAGREIGADSAAAAYTSEAEAELARRLTEGPMAGDDPEEQAVARLSPRWEVRIQSEYDPVAEETAMYRKLAKEVDGRYDRKK